MTTRVGRTPRVSEETLWGVVFWVAAFFGLWAARFPYLFSPPYILDNDEAVLGLMAKHLAEGREFPVYFYGQNYGVALLETLPVAGAFELLGVSPLVLSQTIFALFLIGLFAFYIALRQLSGSVAWGRLLALVLGLLPTWIVWSMKARGIYVSGFLLSGVALALLTRSRVSAWHLFGAAVAVGLLVNTQPLWLVLVAPFALLVRARRRDVLLAAGLVAVLAVVPRLFAPEEDPFWQPQPFSGFDLRRLERVPMMLARAFAARVTPHEPGPYAETLAIVAGMVFFLFLSLLSIEAVRRRSRKLGIVTLGMVGSVLYVASLRLFVPRYLLPATVYAVVGAAVWLGVRGTPFRGLRRAFGIAVVVVLGVGATRLGHEQPVPYAEPNAQRDLHRLIAGLREDGVRRVYAQSNAIQWQLMFYSDEEIIARGRAATDRYPAYSEAVANARRKGEPVALVADVRTLRAEYPQLDSFPGYLVSDRYLRYDDPPVEVLRLLGFEPDPLPERPAQEIRRSDSR